MLLRAGVLEECVVAKGLSSTVMRVAESLLSSSALRASSKLRSSVKKTHLFPGPEKTGVRTRPGSRHNLMLAACRIAMFAGTALLGTNALGSTSTWPLLPDEFGQMCLRGTDDCAYVWAHFESNNIVTLNTYMYFRLTSQSDIGNYDDIVKGRLALKKSKSVKEFSVKRYDPTTKAWIPLSLTDACQYCLNKDDILKRGTGWVRTHLVMNIVVGRNEFPSYGASVHKGKRLKIKVTVAAPGYSSTSKDHSPLYIDSRIKGRHATSSFTYGVVSFDLDGSKVPGELSDYVAVSPVESWADVASEYRERDSGLLRDSAHLPGSTQGTVQQRLDGVARQLQAYGIRYDPQMGGIFPSLTPGQIIAGHHADCKALTTLGKALLQRVGVRSHVVILNEYSQPPLSFSVPVNSWGPLHAILYLPSLDLYVDPSLIVGFGADWKTSAETYRGAIALDTTTGAFVVIH